MSESQAPTMSASIPSKPSVLPALIHQEWKFCRGTIIGLSVLWFIGIWVLVAFQHPAWLMAIGLFYVLFVTSGQGGRDVIEGTEEFSFALPPGRGPLFISRIVPGLAFLTVNGLIGGAAIAFNLPQKLWGILFSSGLTDPFSPVQASLWYALALFVPLAAHTITFTTAALIGTRAGVSLSWLLGFIGVGAITLAGISAENLLWSSPNGLLTCTALVAASVLAPFIGYQFYLRKEATGGRGGATGRSNAKGLLLVATLVAVIFLFLLMTLWLRSSAERESTLKAHRTQEIRAAEQFRNAEKNQKAESESH